MPAPTSLKETSRSRNFTGRDVYSWWGDYEYTCAKADAENSVAYLFTLTATFAGHTLRPKSVRVTGDDPETPGNALIQVRAETDYNPAVYPLSQASIGLYSRSQFLKQMDDPNDNGPIESVPDANGEFWTVVQGSNIVPKPRPVIVLRTAFTASTLSDQIDDYMTMIGQTNADAFVYLPFVLAETLMLIDVRIPKWFLLSAGTVTVPVELIFWWRPDGFACVSQKRRRMIQQTPVLHVTDDATSATRTYVHKTLGTATADAALAKVREVLLTKPAGISYARALAVNADFSAFDALLAWMGS